MAKDLAQVLSRHKLFSLVLLGLLLRLFLSVQIYSGDVNNHIAWGKDSLALGFSGIYEREFFFRYGVLTPTYPPIPLFLFTAFYWLYDWVYQTSWNLNSTINLFPSNFIFFLEDQDTLPAFLKIPAILADLGIAVVVFMFTRSMFAKKLVRRKSNLPFLAAALVLFNPAFFYNSAYWGQIEAVPLFFILLAFYFLLYAKRFNRRQTSFNRRQTSFIWSAVFLTLALLSKQTVIVFVPVFAIAFLQRFGLQKSAKALLASIAIFWISFLPFYKTGNILSFPVATYWDKIQTGSGSDFVTDHAFNFWAYVSGLGKVSDSIKFWFGLSYALWGYILFGLILGMILYKVYQQAKRATGLPVGELAHESRQGGTNNSQLAVKLEETTPSGVELHKKDRDLLTMLLAASLSAFAAFLFLTRMHERYLEQALPFLLLVGLKNKTFIWIFLGLSVFHFINLYHNWWAPRVTSLVELLSEKVAVDVLILVAISSFFFLFVQYLKGLTNE